MFRLRVLRALVLPLTVLLTCACGSEGEEAGPNPDADLLGPIAPLSTSVSDGQGNTYAVGYDQGSGQQFAWVRKTTGGTQVYKTFVSSAPGIDQRATKIYRDPENGDLWIVVTMDGGSTNANYVNRSGAAGAFSGVPFPDYGAGGGPRVSVVARVDPATGSIVKGTFLRARLSSNGNTNGFTVETLHVVGGKLVVDATSASFPPAAGSTAGNFRPHPDATDANRTGQFFKVRVQLPRSLASLERVAVYRP